MYKISELWILFLFSALKHDCVLLLHYSTKWQQGEKRPFLVLSPWLLSSSSHLDLIFKPSQKPPSKKGFFDWATSLVDLNNSQMVEDLKWDSCLPLMRITKHQLCLWYNENATSSGYTLKWGFNCTQR